MATLEVSPGRRAIDTLSSVGCATMRGTQESRSIVRMTFDRQTLSQATISVFMMLVPMVVMCQGEATVLIPLQNETVILGGEGHFFCQLKGTTEQLRFNGIAYKKKNLPDDISVNTMYHIEGKMGELNVFNITITIMASKERNNTIVECHDLTDKKNGSKATLIVQGAPAEPEVSYEVLLEQKEIHLSWPRPFTWEEYNITSYQTVCGDTEYKKSYKINNTENRAVINQAVKLAQNIPGCYKLQCTVTASNALDESTPDVTDISIPLPVTARPGIQEKTVFTEDQNPEVTFCVTLPVLCRFQNVTYTMTISHQGDKVMQWSKEFSYSGGYSGECITELVTDGLEEGTEYDVLVTVDAGELAGSSSSSITFKPEIRVEGVSSPGSDEFYQTKTGITVITVVGAALVIVLLVLIAVVAVSYRKRGSQSIVKAPIKRTVTPMVKNPIYGEESPFYEQVRPAHMERVNSATSHSNLDSPFRHAPSPTHSSGSHTPTSPHHLNNAPKSPSSTDSSTAFNWPYAATQQTKAATFDAIEAEVRSAQSRVPLPPSTPVEDSYMAMLSVAKPNNMNVQNNPGHPRYAIDIHGNQYSEC